MSSGLYREAGSGGNVPAQELEIISPNEQDVLRVKGLLDVGGPGPVLVNGVQHVIHPPQHLDRWPDRDRRSRIVFIARGIEPGEVEASLAAFTTAAEPVSRRGRAARPRARA